jgi:hypothetical protein
MSAREHDARMLLDLELEGALDEEGRRALAAAVTPELEQERRELEALRRLLAGARVSARPGFERRVMEALPPPPWAVRGVRALALPAAVLVVFCGLAAFLLGLEGSRLEGGSALAAVGAVVDFALATTLSGAGLLSASWRGLGLAFGEGLGAGQLALFGAGVLASNLLLVMLLRRRRPAVETRGARR